MRYQPSFYDWGPQMEEKSINEPTDILSRFIYFSRPSEDEGG